MIERGSNGDSILVIGYGNELRGDDGIGPRVAQVLAAENYPGVRVRSVLQLMPELAAELAGARVVVFVDASAEAGRVTVELAPLDVRETADWSTHAGDPRSLIALTRAVYGRAPEAWWLTVPGRDFGFGEKLSPTAQQQVRQAVALLRTWIQGAVQDPQSPLPRNREAPAALRPRELLL